MLSNNEGRRNDLERAIVAVADPDARPRPAGQNWRKMPATEATLELLYWADIAFCIVVK